MIITLIPINKILDDIYSNPSSYFTSADIYEDEDNSFKTKDEITNLIIQFVKEYIKSVLYKDPIYGLESDGVISFNGSDLYQILMDLFVNEKNDKEIKSVLKGIGDLNHDFYIDDIYIDRIDTSCITVEINSLFNRVKDISKLTKDDIELDNVIFTGNIDKGLINV